MNISVVIGANFGDEGKGLSTDFLASRCQAPLKTLVVRFNGGAQAGHTVETPEGKRHVFAHFGSGTLAGANTYLSRFFLSDPISFMVEFKQLTQLLGKAPSCYVDPLSCVVTPYDFVINRIIEDQRGDNKHGSCGFGINETVERSLLPTYRITVADLFDTSSLIEKLKSIHADWAPQRLKQLGVSIDSLKDNWKKVFESEFFWQQYVEEYVKFFLDSVVVKSMTDLIENDTHLLFEGAQGLLLDQEKGTFPHVTRSYTGLRNVIQLIQEMNIDDHVTLNVFYASRAYLTRHGAGSLPFELFRLPYPRVHDKTNLTNEYQGKLRFSYFNLDLFLQAIEQEWREIPSNMAVLPHLIITCLDQVDDEFFYIHHNREIKTTVENFLKILSEQTKIEKILRGYGPTREQMVVS